MGQNRPRRWGYKRRAGPLPRICQKAYFEEGGGSKPQKWINKNIYFIAAMQLIMNKPNVSVVSFADIISIKAIQ